MRDNIIEFLEQSNFIEGVIDGLDQAVYAWEYIRKVQKLKTSDILLTHKILMLNQPIFGYQRGYFRKVGVRIGANYGMNWKLIPEAIAQWCKKVNQPSIYSLTKQIDLEIREDHIKFEKIHPFVDGNGRLGRILMNWQRVKNGLDILVIKEEKKQNYYKWFE